VAAVLAFLIALVVSMALMPTLMRLALRLKLVDLPDKRKVHTQPIPRVGGVAMALGIAVALLLAGTPDRFTGAYLLSAGILLAFGVADDRLDLDYRIKFIGQFLAIAVILWGGDLLVANLTLGDRIPLPVWLSWPLTVLFVLGVTNAVNLADGLDGLAGGTTLLSLCALGILAHSNGLEPLSVVALASAGAILGFLRFNTHPASVFMGDAGSQLLGFTVAVVGVAVTQDETSVYSTALPLLLAGIPILDTLSVMTQRAIERRSMFKADRNHLHHKLLGLGFDQRESVTLIYAAQIVLFIVAYALRFESDLAIVGTFGGFSALAIGSLQYAHRTGWRLRSKSEADRRGPISRAVERWSAPGTLNAWSSPVLVGAIGSYALVVILQVRSLASDSLWVAGFLLVAALVAQFVLRGRPLQGFEKAACFVVAALLVYLDVRLDPAERWIPWADWILPVCIAAITALRLRWARDRRFELTPLDLLIVFMALVVPSLPGLLQLPHGAPLGLAKLIVLFYAIELLAGGGGAEASRIRFGSIVILAGLCLRPAISLLL
jgi:UDP-GlcNAc:undecaprenyl-phosphate GlcNAc-1-phosphate transferase